MSEPAVDGPVPAALDGERVDRAVALLAGIPRTEAAAMVDAGRVRVGGRVPASRSRRLRQGERLWVDAPDPPRRAMAADHAVSVPVVWADAELIVVDKPAGMVVHPGAGHERGTLVQGLVASFPDVGRLATGDAAGRPGIVHRLDRGTSGLLVVARTERARAGLVAQMAARTVERAYSALVAGTVEADAGVIDAPLGRGEADPTRVEVRAGGRPARTRYRVVERYHGPAPATLLECRLETGRTHQIRVHLAAIGHPVAGDTRYGGPPLLERPFLHAGVLGFDHPGSGQRLRFESPLPADLRGPLERL
ncbi:MAG TPA: RluA family pseudouridine synthase [Acidimicrobiales bacterium]|nr:RluA family pseudouridine synthase [Acidimicrobiales bacterium]